MNPETPSFEVLLQSAKELLESGKDTTSIQKFLSESGTDPKIVNTIISQLKSQLYLKRRKRGIILGATGSGILLTGFLLTVLLFHQGSDFNLVMYGMTSVGVILLFAGMIEIMGW